MFHFIFGSLRNGKRSAENYLPSLEQTCQEISSASCRLKLQLFYDFLLFLFNVVFKSAFFPFAWHICRNASVWGNYFIFDVLSYFCLFVRPAAVTYISHFRLPHFWLCCTLFYTHFYDVLRLHFAVSWTSFLTITAVIVAFAVFVFGVVSVTRWRCRCRSFVNAL